jgi:hypothetical protein
MAARPEHMEPDRGCYELAPDQRNCSSSWLADMIAELGHDVVAEAGSGEAIPLSAAKQGMRTDSRDLLPPFVALGCISARHHTEPPIDPSGTDGKQETVRTRSVPSSLNSSARGSCPKPLP